MLTDERNRFDQASEIQHGRSRPSLAVFTLGEYVRYVLDLADDIIAESEERHHIFIHSIFSNLFDIDRLLT